MSSTPVPRRVRRRLGAAALSGLALVTSFGVARPALAATPPPPLQFGFKVFLAFAPPGTPPIEDSLSFGQPKGVSIVGDDAPELEVEIGLSGDPLRPVRFRSDMINQAV